jgi:hypothetical protein
MLDDLTFLQMLTLGLVGLLFFRDEIMPWIKHKLGIPDKTPATKESMEKLSQHVNHTQTDILDTQTKILEDVRACVKDIRAQHLEWEKFGIPTRDCKHTKKQT